VPSAALRPPDQHDDGELEPLRLVDGEQTDHVAGVVDQRFLLARRLAGLGGPGEELAQAAAAGGHERPRPFDELLDVGDRLRGAGPARGEELEATREAHELADELVRLTRGPQLVKPTEYVHGGQHRIMAFGLFGREDVEHPAPRRRVAVPRPEAHQVLVAEAEVRGMEGAVQRGTVARVVGGAQAEQGVGDLAALEVRLAALDDVGHVGGAQRLLVRLEARGRTEQKGDVAPARGARGLAPAAGRGIAVLDPPPRRLLVVHAPQQSGHRLRLVGAREVGLAASRAVGAAEEHGDACADGRRPVGRQRPVVRLPAGREVLFEDRREDLVHPVDELRRGAKVAGQLLDPARPVRLPFDHPLHLVVERDVRAPEAVDGLLRVADHEQLPRFEDDLAPVTRSRFPLAQQQDDLGLQRVGVLELVDQDVAEALLQGTARVAVSGEQVTQATEKVGEVEAALRDLRRARPAAERVGDGERQLREVGGVGLARRVDDPPDRPVSPHEPVLAALRVVPVALVAAGGTLHGQIVEQRRRQPVDVGRGIIEELPTRLRQVVGGEAPGVVGSLARRDAVALEVAHRLAELSHHGGDIGLRRRVADGIDVVALAEHALRACRQLAHRVEPHAGPQQS